jgi:hypothetical protein
LFMWTYWNWKDIVGNFVNYAVDLDISKLLTQLRIQTRTVWSVCCWASIFPPFQPVSESFHRCEIFQFIITERC